MADNFTEDFLATPEPVVPAYAEEATATSTRRRGPAAWMSTGAWLLAGLVLGATVVAMLHTSKPAGAAGLPGAPSANQAPAGQGPQQGFTGGPPGGFGSGIGGGLPGEQHVVGTLTSVGGSSITVKSTNGTTTYPIDARTLLVKNGQRVPLSALTAGDPVVVHAYPSNGSTQVELVLDGVPPGDDGGAGTTTTT